MGPDGEPRRGYRIREKFLVDHSLRFLNLTFLSLSKQERRPVPRRENISEKMNKLIPDSELLNFLKSVELSFCGPVGLMPV